MCSVSHHRQIKCRGKQRVAGCQMQALRLAGQAVRLSGAALRQTKIDRLQGGGVAAPAVSSFLERERLSDLHPVCDRKLSRLAGAGFGLPDFGSQHVPVQLDASGLHTANGDSTIISTAAVTKALCSATSLSI